MIIFVIFLSGLEYVLTTDNSILCTSSFCDSVKCQELPEKCKIQNSTHNGVLLPSPTACNCCQYCIENSLEGDDCTTGDVSNPIPEIICGPGLYCEPTQGTDGVCKKMNTNCMRKQDAYDAKRLNGTLGYMEVQQACDGDGEFAPYNCIPGQSCYCVNADGSRIFGESDFTSMPDSELKCKCSRDYMNAVGLINRTLNPGEFFHCAPNGDYEAVQCLYDQCFCVDTYDGAPTYPDETTVNVTDISRSTLKCYKHEEAGIYHPKCETEYLKIYKQYTSYEENNSYRIIVGFEYPKCDVDGTYQAVQENDTHKYCVDKEGTVLTAVDKTTEASLAETMNCKCSRARLIMTTNEVPSCDENGNYSDTQCRRGVCRCVDSDGNQVCENQPCEAIESEKESLGCTKKY